MKNHFNAQTFDILTPPLKLTKFLNFSFNFYQSDKDDSSGHTVIANGRIAAGSAGVLVVSSSSSTTLKAAQNVAMNTIKYEDEETDTAPEGEGEDDSVTRCICDLTHDDGYMICCDKCS